MKRVSHKQGSIFLNVKGENITLRVGNSGEMSFIFDHEVLHAAGSLITFTIYESWKIEIEDCPTLQAPGRNLGWLFDP